VSSCQGGIGLQSPFLFLFYVRNVVNQVTQSKIGCNIYVILLMYMTTLIWCHLHGEIIYKNTVEKTQSQDP